MLTLRNLTPFDSVIQDMFRASGWTPALDLVEAPGAYQVHLELPGVAPENVEIEIVDGRLEVRGDKTVARAQEDSTWHRAERGHGRFRRLVTLPDDVDAGKIDAVFEHGVLTITPPKREEAKARRIEIKTR